MNKHRGLFIVNPYEVAASERKTYDDRASLARHQANSLEPMYAEQDQHEVAASERKTYDDRVSLARHQANSLESMYTEQDQPSPEHFFELDLIHNIFWGSHRKEKKRLYPGPFPIKIDAAAKAYESDEDSCRPSSP